MIRTASNSAGLQLIVSWALFAIGLNGAAAAGDPRTSAPTEPLPIESAAVGFDAGATDIEATVEHLLARMTLDEKIGQMYQVAPQGEQLTPELHESIRAGAVGALINVASAEFAKQAQHIASEESRLKIPLLVGRDVIHGYRTIFPISLGQAATWNPNLVEQAAKIAANEAAQQGINWTFAPMLDICRDPRWGRIAETLGEDPVLCSALSAAMVRGFQQQRDGHIHGLLACAKHFVGYGLTEGGRDYNRVSVSESDLQNIYLRPFHAATDAGCRTIMTTFSEVNGVPGTAHRDLITGVLRDKWQFSGFVVSDWNSVKEMVRHGYSASATAAAEAAVNAGVDMEMASPTFHDHLASLMKDAAVSQETIDDAVRRILRVKFQLASSPSDRGDKRSGEASETRSVRIARKLARQSLVLLKNDGDVLPLHSASIRRVAVIGALANDQMNQLGCWALDRDLNKVITPLAALKAQLGPAVEVLYAKGAGADFSTDRSEIEEAKHVAAQADVVVLVVGETALLSGEGRSRSDLNLPGVQSELVQAIAHVGKPTVMIVLAGRPLTIGAECKAVDAVIYAWHPGSAGGPAIADILCGKAAPSGKLPVTLPRSVGQIPLYYSHTNTGRPNVSGYEPLTESEAADLPTKFQYRSHYLDSDTSAQFPFGFGMSYTRFTYSHLVLSAKTVNPDQTIGVQVRVKNAGDRIGTEIAQLYIRDQIAQPVRPVRELKSFRRIRLQPGESKQVEFTLSIKDLASLDDHGDLLTPAGKFHVWVGGDSMATLHDEFELTSPSENRSRLGNTATATLQTRASGE